MKLNVAIVLLGIFVATGVYADSFANPNFSVRASEISVRELTAIITDKNLAKSISPTAIVSITKVSDKVYEIVSADGCRQKVSLIDGAEKNDRFIGNGQYKPMIEKYEAAECPKR